MWSFTSAWGRASVVALALALGACATDDEAGVTGFGPKGIATDAPVQPTAEPTAPPSGLPYLAGLVIVPESFQLSSDPAAVSGTSRVLTVLARMSTGQQFPTEATWTATPTDRVRFTGPNTVAVVPGAPGGQVMLTASSGSIQATVSVLVVPRVLTVSGVAVSSSNESLHIPDSNGGSLPGLPHRTRLTATVTMSDGSTTGDVTWASTDNSVARVDATGEVVACGVGAAEIVATANQDAARSARCQVTVTADGIVNVGLH